MIAGVVSGVVLHRLRAVRETLDPLFATYYAIPVFAFYPLLIILFGLGDAPQILIGFMLGVVAVVVSTLNGLDRVPRALIKTARVARMGAVETTLRISLPYAAPYILTGAKLAVAYSLIGIIGAEFIMSRGGMGYEISFAYNNFDNATMYPLILLILLVSITINMLLARWEKRLMRRRGQQ
jgi:NitT/TauT family transport system permease protein